VQKYTDSSISKTVNGPEDNTVEDVERLYMLAYDTGCKGITYYRQGSRDAVLEAVDTKPKEKAEKPEEAPKAPHPEVHRSTLKKRPDVVSGYTRQIRAPEGKVNITLNSDDEGLLEVFINLGKAGSDIAAMAEALGRLISFALQMPSPMSPNERAAEIADQLRGIGGSRSVGFGPGQVKSLPDAVGQALLKHLQSEGIALSNGNGNGHADVESKELVAVVAQNGNHGEETPESIAQKVTREDLSVDR